MLSDIALVPYSSADEVFCPFYLPDTPAHAHFDRADYVQEEYLLTGSGELYAPGDGPPRLVRSGLPFRDPRARCPPA